VNLNGFSNNLSDSLRYAGPISGVIDSSAIFSGVGAISIVLGGLLKTV